MDIKSAVSFNRGRGYNEETWKKIQALVGTTADGDPGPATARAVARWQTSEGLTADGKFGAGSMAHARLDLDPAVKPDVTVGVWWDLSPTHTIAHLDRRMEDIALLGISEVRIMLDRSDAEDEPSWRWTREQLAVFADRLHAAGVAVVLTLWPRPQRRFLDAMLLRLRPFVEVARPMAIEVDVEGNWRERHRDGFESLHDAARHMVDGLRALCPRVEATSHPWHQEIRSGEHASVTPLVDAIAHQAYSHYDKGDEKRAWGAPQGPGGMQRWSHGRAAQHGPPTICALAAWDQTYPGHGPEEAMALAWDTAVDELGYRHVCYWSAKWCMGPRANDYARRFLAGKR